MNQFARRFLVSALAAVSAGTSARTAAGQDNPVDFMNAVRLREQTTSGRYVADLPLRRQSAIIDDHSRLIVHFDKTALASLVGFEGVRARFDSLRASRLYMERTALFESLGDSARAQTDTARRRQFLDRQKTAERALATARNRVLSSGGGYRFVVTARVEPKEGEPYDIPVQGYTTIRTDTRTQVAKNPSDSTAAESVTVVQTRETSSEVRVFAPEFQLVHGQPELGFEDDLPDGIIELHPWNLDEGDRVVVSVENQYQGMRKLSWTLHVRDIGVHSDQSATLLMVNRLGELPDDTLEQRSRFEPAPGASFMFSVRTRSPGWNFVNPAIGLNGSFVDFRSDKSVEVGLGPVISLFDGILQASYGWNLSTRARNHYWSIGIGFLDLASKFGGGDSQKSGTTATGAVGTTNAALPPPPAAP